MQSVALFFIDSPAGYAQVKNGKPLAWSTRNSFPEYAKKEEKKKFLKLGIYQAVCSG